MQRTPLYEEYAHLSKVVNFNGWALPVQFGGIVQEHLHTRAKAGLFDCSHMGEFLLKGHDAIAAFDRLVFSDMLGLRPGRCRYSAILNEQGGIIDDCVGLKLADDELYVVTNAGPLEAVWALLQGCGAVNLSPETAKIDVQGPLSREVLLAVGMEGAAPLNYWTGTRSAWHGEELVITRAGYTGELGYELFVPNGIAVELWRALLAHPEVMPSGLGARDTLRLEVGYPLNGEDLDPAKTPLEASMERYIVWEKEFTGKPELEAQRGADHTVLTAIRSRDRRAPRHGFELKRDGEVVGRVTSGTFGPSVGAGVGLADLPKHLAVPGVELTAGPRDMPVETAATPIYQGGTCRVRFN